ncbi:uncharacterized protein LOC116341143 [Contarinia nasturtii]|uniref:uncharacterized protein LOC116341143 n=1 Tax=Contarinia nasturtii TaxID=265458 RepID=UPI0012D3D8A1|nr:uncharacterized protein LOC116341143 [Contarinia nasturtii]
MKPIFVLSILSLAAFIQVINGEDATFGNVVNVFNAKCTEKKVPVKSLDFMVKIASNVDQVEQNLKAPAKQFMSEEKVTNILKQMPDEMTVLKLKLETGARDFVHSVIDWVNNEQASIEKLNHEVAAALAFAPHSEDFKTAFNHWAADKNTKVDHLKKAAGSIDAMQAYFSQLHATFENEMAEAEKVKSNIEHGMNSANTEFDKLHGTNSEAAQKIIEQARLHMTTVTENQAKLLIHLGALKAVLDEYNEERTAWAKYVVGINDSFELVTFDKVAKVFKTKCTEKKVPVKSLDFMVKISPNVNQFEQHLKVPMKQLMSEEKVANILKQMPDEMTVLKLKLETGARDLIHSIIDWANNEQISIEKLNYKVASALAFKPHNEEFKKAFSHWVTDKNTKADHLKKAAGGIDAMQAYYNQLHAAFDKEMTEAQNLRSNIEQGIVSANAVFDKLHGTNSEAAQKIVEEARLKLSTVTENQTKLVKHLNIVMTILSEYNAQRSSWAEYVVGKLDSIHLPSATHVDSLIDILNSLKL